MIDDICYFQILNGYFHVRQVKIWGPFRFVNRSIADGENIGKREPFNWLMSRNGGERCPVLNYFICN